MDTDMAILEDRQGRTVEERERYEARTRNYRERTLVDGNEKCRGGNGWRRWKQGCAVLCCAAVDPLAQEIMGIKLTPSPSKSTTSKSSSRSPEERTLPVCQLHKEIWTMLI
jgi:hypothetical protein